MAKEALQRSHATGNHSRAFRRQDAQFVRSLWTICIRSRKLKFYKLFFGGVGFVVVSTLVRRSVTPLVHQIVPASEHSSTMPS